MTTRLAGSSVLVLLLVVGSAPADAQNKNRSSANWQTSNEAIEVRHKCFLEAQAQIPADPAGPTVTQARRTPIYTACTRRSGVRP